MAWDHRDHVRHDTPFDRLRERGDVAPDIDLAATVRAARDGFAPAGAGDRDHRQRYRPDAGRRLRLAHRRERQRLLTGPWCDGRPAGTRDDGRRNRSRRIRAPSGRRAERAARRCPHCRCERRVARERRDRRNRLDSRAPGAVRHPRRQSVDGRRQRRPASSPIRSTRQSRSSGSAGSSSSRLPGTTAPGQARSTCPPRPGTIRS